MIKRFERRDGRFIEKIYGQERLAYAMSDSSDLYDLVEWAEHGGYPGSTVAFYDYESGRVYKPFRKTKNVIFAPPVFADGFYYLLRADYGKKRVALLRWRPDEKPAEVACFGTDEVKLYNLRIVGTLVHVISQDGETAECYYPEPFALTLTPRQSVVLVEDGRIYLEEWVEEGWDSENDRATPDYRFYHKVLVKDFSGRTLSTEIGALTQGPDGTWWIS